MASLIASGSTLSLAAPVLVSIYRGLSQIARSSSPERANAFLPWHYVFGWTARYFDTHHRAPSSLVDPFMIRYSGEGGSKPFDDHAARALIHRGHDIYWHTPATRNDRTETKVNDGRLSFREKTFFLSVRSSLMVLHRDGLCWVEPYSPCRFARQFGFYQMIPKELATDIRDVPIESAGRFWESFIDLKSCSRLVFPVCPSELNGFTSVDFRSWWSKVHGTYLIDGRHLLLIAREKKNVTLPKAKPIRLPRPLKASLPIAPRLASKVVVQEKMNCTTSKEKRPSDTELDGSDNTSRSDAHWKRQKRGRQPKEPERQVIHCSLDDIDVDWSEFFKELPSLSNFSVNNSGLLVYPDPLPDDGVECSENSANGPDAFTLVLRNSKKNHDLPATVGENEVSSPALPSLGGTSCQQLESGVENVHAGAKNKDSNIDATTRPLNHSTIKVPSSVNPRPASHFPSPRSSPPAVSEFNSGSIIDDCYHHLVQMLWKRLKTKISNHPLEDLASKKEDVYKIFGEMKICNKLDLSGLETLLDAFFDNASHHSAAQQNIVGRLHATSYEENHSTFSSQLVDVKATEAGHLEKIESSKSSLAKLVSKREKLEKKVEALKKKEAEAALTLASHEEEWKSTTAQASQLQNYLDELESAPRLQPGEYEALTQMTELLKLARQELLDFNLLN